MKEAFEKIIERLGKRLKFYENRFEEMNGTLEDVEDWGSIKSYKDAIEIVNQVAEEYNDGWIPFEEEEPPHSDEHLLVQCNGRHKNIVFSNAFELASYTEEGWYFPAYPDWDNAEVIAWRELPPAYQPKGE